jgi:hypothetical protein
VSIKDTLQGLGVVMLGLVGFAATAAIFAAFIFGAEWLSVRLLPLMVPAMFWTLVVCVVILLPAAIIRPSRAFASVGLLIASFVFGSFLWVWSFIVTLAIWGVWGVVIGLMVAGVGVVPISFFAMLFHSEWHHRIWDLVILVVLTFGTRALAFWVASKAEPSPV